MKIIIQNLLKQIEKIHPAKDGYKYAIDYNSTYGGYRLVIVNNKSGAHYGCFGGNGCEKRLPYGAFVDKMRTIIGTINEINNKL